MRNGSWWMLVFLVACGDAAPGGGADAGGDGDDGGTQRTTVRVVDDGEPVAGAQVVFHAADGRVDALAIAGDDGVAVHPLAAGGLITVAYPNEIGLTDARVQLITYAGVEPGDDVRVEIPSFTQVGTPPDLGPIVGAVRVEVPPIEGAGMFIIHLGCTDHHTQELVTVVDVPESCLGSDGYVDITVDAYTPPDLPSRLATAYVRGIPVSEGETTTATLPAWIDPLPTVDVTFVDVPAEATDAFAIPVPVADGLTFEPVLADNAAVDGDTVTLSPAFLAGFPDTLDLEARLHAGAGSATTELRFGALVDAAAISGAAMLPFVRAPVLDSERDELRWESTGDLEAAGADAVFVYLRSSRDDGAVTRRYRWTFLRPPGAPPRVALPELPPSLATYRPRAGDDYLEPGVVGLDAEWVPGYAAFLTDHGTRFLDDACVPAEYGTRALLTQVGAFEGPRLQR